MSHSSNSMSPSNSPNNRSPNENNSPINDNNELMNINLRIKKTVNVQVRKTDKIKSLKLQGLSEGVSDSLQELYHGDRYLEDDLTLADYNINPNSTITVELNINSAFSKRIFIKIPSLNNNNHLVTVYAREDDTIHLVKSIVFLKERLQSENFDLMFNGKFLRAYQTIISANIPNEAVLFLVENPEDIITIRVSTYAKGVLPIEVKKLLTVGDLKRLVASMTDSENDNSMIYFAGKVLRDVRTLTSYDIDEQNMVEFVAQFPVNVVMPNGDAVTVKVYPADNASEVISKVARKGMSLSGHAALFFSGVRLDGNRPIAHYNVVEGSILTIGE